MICTFGARSSLHHSGVGILAGSDTPGGFTLRQEMEVFVEDGLLPPDALRTATISPARYLGREDDLGSIAQGKIADLVLLRENPLEDIHNTQGIEAVVFQGHLLERDRLSAPRSSRPSPPGSGSRMPALRSRGTLSSRNPGQDG